MVECSSKETAINDLKKKYIAVQTEQSEVGYCAY